MGNCHQGSTWGTLYIKEKLSASEILSLRLFLVFIDEKGIICKSFSLNSDSSIDGCSLVRVVKSDPARKLAKHSARISFTGNDFPDIFIASYFINIESNNESKDLLLAYI